MKVLVATLIIVSAAGAAMAQKPASQAPPEAAKIYVEGSSLYGEKAREYEAQARIVAELSAAHGHRPQKNSPISAEEVNESVQTLADGNRIVRKSSGKMYRNSEGRVRREMAGGMGGMLGTTYSMGQGISIASPMVAGQLLTTNLKAAKVVEMAAAGQGINVVSQTQRGDLTIAQKRAIEERARATASTAPVAVGGQSGHLLATGTIAASPSMSGALAYTLGGQNPKYDVKNEELGTRDFEGVSAEGTRRTTTIPAEAIGNERPIEVVYERWFSKDLGLVVYSKNTDPRFGEQIYKLINIVRAEPDPSLFALPAKKVAPGEPPTVYRIVEGTPIVVSTTKPAKP